MDRDEEIRKAKETANYAIAQAIKILEGNVPHIMDSQN